MWKQVYKCIPLIANGVHYTHMRLFLFFITMTQVQEAQLRKTKLNLSCVQGNVFLGERVICCLWIYSLGLYGNIGEISVTLDDKSVHLYAIMITSTCHLLLYSYDRMRCWRVIKDKNIYFFMGRSLKLQTSKLKSNLKCLIHFWTSWLSLKSGVRSLCWIFKLSHWWLYLLNQDLSVVCYQREGQRMSNLRGICQSIPTKITLALITCKDTMVSQGY